MIALLRSTRFMSADRQVQVFLEVRRLMDTEAIARGAKTLQFVVIKRFAVNGNQIIEKHSFDTKREAKMYWCEQAVILEDTGMQKQDFHISGFHEEN